MGLSRGRRITFSSSGVLGKNGAAMITLYAHSHAFDQWKARLEEWRQGLVPWPDARWHDVDEGGSGNPVWIASAVGVTLLSVCCIVAIVVLTRRRHAT